MDRALIETGARPKKTTIDVTLRSQQIDYLRRVAEREDVSLSRALACIIETYAEIAASKPRRPTRKARTHFHSTPAHVALIDQLTVKWGVRKSEVVRRVIDGALAADPWIGR